MIDLWLHAMVSRRSDRGRHRRPPWYRALTAPRPAEWAMSCSWCLPRINIYHRLGTHMQFRDVERRGWCQCESCPGEVLEERAVRDQQNRRWVFTGAAFVVDTILGGENGNKLMAGGSIPYSGNGRLQSPGRYRWQLQVEPRMKAGSSQVLKLVGHPRPSPRPRRAGRHPSRVLESLDFGGRAAVGLGAHS